jgi:thiamine pyrophosphokinase
VVCADSAGEAALTWGIEPDYLVGDMDSIKPAALAELQARPSVKILGFKAEKDETDLELAILTALEAGARRITIVGAIGGRLDHMLANIYLLAMPRLDELGAQTRILSEQEEIYLLRPHQSPLKLEGAPGEIVSIFPFNGDTTGVYTERLQYPLKRETLYFGPSRGISNVMLENTAEVGLESGLLLVIHLFK